MPTNPFESGATAVSDEIVRSPQESGELSKVASILKKMRADVTPTPFQQAAQLSSSAASAAPPPKRGEVVLRRSIRHKCTETGGARPKIQPRPASARIISRPTVPPPIPPPPKRTSSLAPLAKDDDEEEWYDCEEEL